VLHDIHLRAEATLGQSSSTITTLVLNVLAAVTTSSTSIDSAFASSIIHTLSALAGNMTAIQADELLHLSAALLNRTTLIDQQAGTLLLEAASDALAGV
jgi:hypothetical protein